MKRRFFQIHLSTAIVLVLWIGAVMCVWMHREPWVLRDVQRVPVVTALPQQIESKSPDGTRIIDIDMVKVLFTIHLP
jgi:hypothetical protein